MSPASDLPAFSLKLAACTYPESQQPVLFIEELNILRGGLTVVLGRSGSGKSTLIEALGLMNDTLLVPGVNWPDSETFLDNALGKGENDEKLSRNTGISGQKDRTETKESAYARFHLPGMSFDLCSLWGDRKKMAGIRRDHFSFIFQSDYLMPYYTCKENMLLARLMQKKIHKGKTEESLHEPMKMLGLQGNGILKKIPNQLAGGQRQRLSFIRAIQKDFDVLFGDEPTGNLDHGNSSQLFGFLRKVLKEDTRSAIIVSHNIEISVEHADCILVLTKQNNTIGDYFELRKDNIFHRGPNSRWNGFDDPDDLINHIKNIL